MDGVDGSDHGPDNVVWLHDPACDDIGGLPVPCSPGSLATWIGDAVAGAGLDDVEVTGVVRGVRRRRACTFDLVDPDATGERTGARIAVVVLPARLDDLPQVRTIADGALVSVTGAVEWDAPWASLRLVASELFVGEQVSAAEGERRATADRLRACGVLEAQRKLSVPALPWRIGLVAGDGTAGAADVESMLRSSGLPWTLLRRSVPMAGPHAPGAIAAGIAALAEQRPDLILLARGGGARVELDCWDTATVVEAIAGCPVPVWTALGHATDRTLADEAANASWPTPSAAASALVARVESVRVQRAQAEERRQYRDRVAQANSRARAAIVAALVAGAALAVVLWAVAR